MANLLGIPVITRASRPDNQRFGEESDDDQPDPKGAPKGPAKKSTKHAESRHTQW